MLTKLLRQKSSCYRINPFISCDDLAFACSCPWLFAFSALVSFPRRFTLDIFPFSGSRAVDVPPLYPRPILFLVCFVIDLQDIAVAC
jgi:hypothetical protein